MILRDYQSRLVSRAEKALETFGNTMAVAPTGSGKTVCLAALAGAVKPKRALVLQHRDELVSQNASKFSMVNPKWPISFFDAKRKSWDGRCTFAMVQTLHKQASEMPAIDLLVVDEAHRAIASTYRTIIDAAKEKNPDLLLAGFTATPARGDGKGIRAVFSNVCDQIFMEELIEAGFLVEPKCYILTLDGVEDALKSVRRDRSGEYDMDQVEEVMNTTAYNHTVIREWKNLAGDRKTIVFCATVEHSKSVCAAFTKAGVIAAHIDGSMPKKMREATLQSFDHGKIQVICNCSVLTEGYDSQPASCVILLRPCSYKSTMLQMVGRGLRIVDPEIYPGVVKRDCLAEGTLVLTDVGEVPIEKVTTSMKVWDGIEFVNHDGPIYKGEQNVIEYEGLCATPDHKVWTKNGWMHIQDCKREQIGICITGENGETVWEVENRFTGDNKDREEDKDKNKVRCMWRRIYKRISQCNFMRRWMPEVRSSSAGSEVACVKSIERKGQVYESREQKILRLRRERNPIQIQLSNRNGCMDNGEPWAGEGKTDRPNRQQRSLRGWKHQIFNCISESIKLSRDKIQQVFTYVSEGSSRNNICRHNNNASAMGRTGCQPNNKEVLHDAIKETKRRVWDILNAGPRHRFTANRLLVSNCMVLDFGVSLKTHGDLSTQIRMDDREKGDVPTKECKQCQGVIPVGTTECPLCGADLESGERFIEKVDGTLVELKLLKKSPFKWIDLFGSSKVMMASGFNAWVGVMSKDGETWTAVAKLKGAGMKTIAVASRVQAIAKADDFLRTYEESDAAKKSKAWMRDPASSAQWAHLARFGYQDDPLGLSMNKYSAACHMNFQFNRRAIEGLVR